MQSHVGAEPITIAPSLDQIYPSTSLLRQGERWNNLVDRFTKVYGETPDYISRAPGRVNIIGDHIDYSLFSVLPAAIEADVIIALKTHPSEDKFTRVTVNNYEASRYPETSFKFDSSKGANEIEIDNSKHHWANYFKCGIKGLLTSFPVKSNISIQLLVWGTVPAGSGLSSSAALTTSSATASAQAFGIAHEISRKRLTEIAIISEQWAGVFSGGMDQAASVFGQRDHLVLIDFVPSLQATPVPIPKTTPGVSFVVAHSLVVADKHKTSKFNYNLRVVETRLCAIIMSKKLGLAKTHTTLREVMDAHFENDAHPLASMTMTTITPKEHIRRLKIMIKKTEEIFGEYPKGETWEQILDGRFGGMSREQFEANVQRGIEIEADVLKLYMRAMHVFEESLRVYEFLQLLKSPTNVNARDLGQLMSQSHQSCDEKFETSCPELQDLIQIATDAGAFGSRVTGAGFGGCTVHLVQEDAVDSFISALKTKYYDKRFKLSEEEFNSACFASKPGGGACLYKVSADSRVS